jgi:hypothetical protein
MKKIQPIQLWVNGSIQTATMLNLSISFDDLLTSCTFFYQLIEENTGVSIGYGNLIMEGEDYLNWDDSNDSAYAYAMTKLNLTPVNI